MDWIKHFIIMHSESHIEINDLVQGIYYEDDGMWNYNTNEFTEYIDGKINGINFGWNKDKQITFINNYRDEKLYGSRFSWYDNGQIEYISEYDENGLAHGFHICLYENGNLEYISKYDHDIECGIYYEWFEDGQISVLNDRRKSFGYEWDPNGQIRHIYNYLNGKNHGTQYEWSYNGMPDCIKNYYNGVEYGPFYHWENNKLDLIEYYKNGKLICEYRPAVLNYYF